MFILYFLISALLSLVVWQVVKYIWNWVYGNPEDVAITILMMLVCTEYKLSFENWNSLNFMLIFIFIKFIFLIAKSYICNKDINEVKLIKLMLLALVFVFEQNLLFSIKATFWAYYSVFGIIFLLNFVLGKIL